ncbi:hypothetical protein BJF93_13925 [Xaviernesmea oryzae]|uniref:Uncharacterized protein n=1 Tax=Xaviernesmea oryzae TaxID=464029 RepID=A0A1Q9ARC9_9HYPH|nr:hypothetical protein [Xaviernesmea oryzae]OLP57931.1 hypothetical protein BJF93_13925 [Xaviernesmea oryzae]SEL30276.1 hypothetical protein SAMN04487976_10779 [Xaviernesmea oryzae]
MKSLLTLYAGLSLSPAAWALNTQLGQILPYRDCAAGSSWTGGSAFALVVVAAGGALLSWRYGRFAIGRAGRAGAYAGALFGLAFCFALILQGAATLLISPCLH